jgi:hypothetical protein
MGDDPTDRGISEPAKTLERLHLRLDITWIMGATRRRIGLTGPRPATSSASITPFPVDGTLPDRAWVGILQERRLGVISLGPVEVSTVLAVPRPMRCEARSPAVADP